MPRKKKTVKLSTYRNKADRLYQEQGMKDRPRCLICMKMANCLHHFFPKSVASSLRYELKNGIPLCAGCHLRLHSSGDPEYEQIIIRKKGQVWYDELKELRKKQINISKTYYISVISELSTGNE
ncbi:MAG: hypothetical protein KGI08_00290 [Thaumarchaeota archaeon]|nr:hypothetical protein [Nitrososphaerota archaeon]